MYIGAESFFNKKKDSFSPMCDINADLCLDDPYYCGLRARIPNFVKKKKKSSDSSGSSKLSSKLTSSTTTASATSTSMMNLGVGGKSGQPQQVSSHHPFWWHSRLYSENPGHPGQFSKFF